MDEYITVTWLDLSQCCAIIQMTAALTRLKPVWNNGSISPSSKIQLMCSLVVSTFLYACESWTHTVEVQRKIQAMEMRCYRKLLRILYKDCVTIKEVSEKEKKIRQTDREVGTQHQGVDRPGVHQVPEGSWEHGKMEETGLWSQLRCPNSLCSGGIGEGEGEYS